MTEQHGPLRGVKVVACSTAQAGTVALPQGVFSSPRATSLKGT